MTFCAAVVIGAAVWMMVPLASEMKCLEVANEGAEEGVAVASVGGAEGTVAVVASRLVSEKLNSE